jgi:hypothetical protein
MPRCVGGDSGRHARHISAILEPRRRTDDLMRNLVPGGYLFTHAMFWTVVAMVAVGTNAVAIILSVGLVLLFLESIGKA